MKKILALLLTSISLHASYETLKDKFLQDLYNEQYGLMRYNEYIPFMQSHISQGEKKLAVYSYLVKHSDSRLSSRYFSCLFHYNLAYFNHYVNPCAVNKKSVKYVRQELHQTLKKIAEQGGGFDAEREYKLTIATFSTSTLEYYSKLNPLIRGALAIARITYPTPRIE